MKSCVLQKLHETALLDSLVRSHPGPVTLDSEGGLAASSISTFRRTSIPLPWRTPLGSPKTAPAAAVKASFWSMMIPPFSPSLRKPSKRLDTGSLRPKTALRLFRIPEAHGAEIAVVLADMMMPIMDGPTLIVALRKLDPTLPVIAASGMNGNGDMDRVKDAGARHFLSKPSTADQLLAAPSSVFQPET